MDSSKTPGSVAETTDSTPLLLPPELSDKLGLLEEVLAALGVDSASLSSSILPRLSHLLDRSTALEPTKTRLAGTQEDLEGHLAWLKHQNALLEHHLQAQPNGPSWDGELDFSSIQASESLAAEELEHEREKVLLKAKGDHRELEALLSRSHPPNITISALLAQQTRNKQIMADIKFKKAKIKAFQGLPPNLDLARYELRMAQSEHIRLNQLREKLLSDMAAGVA